MTKKISKSKYRNRMVYVVYDTETKKIRRFPESNFKSMAQFKAFIRNDGDYFGREIVNSRTSDLKRCKNYDFIESEKLVRNNRIRYMIHAEYDYKGHRLQGNSAPLKSKSEGSINDAKSQAKQVIAAQIMQYTSPSKYNEKVHDYDYFDTIDEMSEQIDESEVRYTYVYSREKYA